MSRRGIKRNGILAYIPNSIASLNNFWCAFEAAEYDIAINDNSEQLGPTYLHIDIQVCRVRHASTISARDRKRRSFDN
jgi:hypothetical protein